MSSGDRAWNWSPSTNPSIWICNVEVIPHISIKVRRWLKGCILTVSGHQNESEQIVSPVHSHSTAPKLCISGQGFLLEQCSVCHLVQHTKRYRCFLGHLVYLRPGVFNLLSSRANLHLSYNPTGRSHCILQNHHGYIKQHHRGMGASAGDVGEEPMT